MAIGNIRLTRGFIRMSQFLGIAGPGPALSQMVVPVMDFERLAAFEEIYFRTAVVAGNGDVTITTVPEGEIWVVKWIAYGRSSGDYNIAALEVGHKTGLAAAQPIDIQGVTTTPVLATAFNSCGKPYVMYPGQFFQALIDTYVSTGSVNIQYRAQVIEYNPDEPTNY